MDIKIEMDNFDRMLRNTSNAHPRQAARKKKKKGKRKGKAKDR